MAAWDDPEGYRRSLERKLSRVRALAAKLEESDSMAGHFFAAELHAALEDQ